MITITRLVFVALLLNASLTISAESSDRPDLEHLLNDPAALQKLVIRYQPNIDEVLFVYGTGKVVKQAYPRAVSDVLLPTCTGQISETEVKELVKTFIDHRFLDLPEHSYAVIIVSDDMYDFWKALKLRSIILDDGRVRAKRGFAEGEYMGKKEPIPPDFVAIESALRSIEQKALTVPCHLAPGIKLPSITGPLVASPNVRKCS